MTGRAFALVSMWLLFWTPLWAGNDAPQPTTGAQQTQEVTDEECYCSVRKQQQVKARLEKKKKTESE